MSMGISTWSCEVLAAWLRSKGKWQEAELLRGADVTGSHLVSMPDEEFAEMVKEVFPPELRTFGKRKDLKNLIAEARRAEEQGAEVRGSGATAAMHANANASNPNAAPASVLHTPAMVMPLGALQPQHFQAQQAEVRLQQHLCSSFLLAFALCLSVETTRIRE